MSVNRGNRLILFTGQQLTATHKALNHCALDNEYEDDDEYERQRCLTLVLVLDF